MSTRLFSSVLLMLVFASAYSPACRAADDRTERQTEVTMRMIGHQLLLSSGDSTSRVLPIENAGGRYHIPFESDFAFDPEQLVATVDSVMGISGFTDHYLVEVESCDSNLVVYSYEVGKTDSPDMVPCKARLQPEGCYGIFVTLFDDGTPVDSVIGNASTADQDGIHSSSLPFWAIPVFLLLALALWMWNKNRKQGIDPDGINIGDFRFDPKGMTLQFKDETIELTGKESELLLLLYSSANTTVEREMILKKVWGDDGDYIGRTLDVFISKLRKKLQADSTVKILNIRGVGYKLVYSLA